MFYSGHLASEKLFLPVGDREERTSFVLQDLGEYLLVVVFRDVFAQQAFESSSFNRSCLVDVGVGCSGFTKAGSMRSLGLLPMANSTGV